MEEICCVRDAVYERIHHVLHQVQVYHLPCKRRALKNVGATQIGYEKSKETRKVEDLSMEFCTTIRFSALKKSN